jgi:arsenite-transporting ATPase
MSADDDIFFDVEAREPTLQNVLDQESLKMVFVGGKGGVGKTTISCSLAALLSEVRGTVLIISTDPAHNLSDAFSQQFGPKPSLVEGFSNLFAMEVEPPTSSNLTSAGAGGSAEAEAFAGMFRDMAGKFPGIDEVVSFLELMAMVRSLDFDVIVFDTAPTGHTLRLLQLPSVMRSTLSTFSSLGGMMPLVSSVGAMLGMDIGATGGFEQDMAAKQQLSEEIQTMFRDPKQTTFVCVCIAEILSMYETERLVQELRRDGIDTHNLVVNQLLFPQEGCSMCTARSRIQQKYLDQILELYQDFHVCKMPLFPDEVRGPQKIKAFAKRLLNPVFCPPTSLEETSS